MALAQISDVWTPAIWIQGMREKQNTFPSVLNSGVAIGNAIFDGIASGAGTSANIPFYKDISTQSDEPQREDTAATVQGLTSGLQVAPILNRVSSNQVSALAAQVSGSRPVDEFTNVLTTRRLKQRNAPLVALLRGAFAGLGASGATAALDDMRLDLFDESGTDATSSQTMGADAFITGKALLGELGDTLASGALIAHPNVIASLERADKDSFHLGVESGLPFTVRTYRGVPVFSSSLLVRAGTSNGYVYESYLLSSGIIAKGEKAQIGGTPANPAIDV